MSEGKSSLMQVPANFMEAILTGIVHFGLDKYYFYGAEGGMMVLGLAAAADVLSVTVATGIAGYVAKDAASRAAFLTYAPPLVSGLLYVLGAYLVGGNGVSKLNQFLAQAASSAGGSYLSAPVRKVIGAKY